MNRFAIVSVAMLALTPFMEAEAKSCNYCSLKAEINRVDDEDMRVKRGVVHGDTLTLRVEDEKRTRGRPFIFGRDVHIDVSSLEESAEIAAEAAAREAGDASVLAEAMSHAEHGDAATLGAAVSFAEQSDASVREYSDMNDAALLDLMAGVEERAFDHTDSVHQHVLGLDDQVQGIAGDVNNLYDVTAGLEQRNREQDVFLNTLDIATANNARDIRELEFALDQQRRRYREAIAGVTALSMVQQDPSADGVQLSAGVGHFQGQTAGSVMIGTRIADRVYVNAGASYGAVTTYGASATVRLGGRLFAVARRK